MFSRLMVPVDLAHKDKLRPALDCARDLAKLYKIPVTYVGVTSSAPSSTSKSPEEFKEKLQSFVKSETGSGEIDAGQHVEIAHDPAVEVEDALMRAIDETGADLVVMASHVPGALEYIWPSNGGKLAEHAKCSVMLVRS